MLAFLVSSALFAAAATTVYEQPAVMTFASQNGDASARASGDASSGPLLVCLPAGYFEVSEGERIVREDSDGIHIESSRGSYVILPGYIPGAPSPDAGALVRRDMSVSVYRFDAPGLFYAFALRHPVQNVEIPLAFMTGPALGGDRTDEAVYSRLHAAPPPTPCDRHYTQGG